MLCCEEQSSAAYLFPGGKLQLRNDIRTVHFRTKTCFYWFFGLFVDPILTTWVNLEGDFANIYRLHSKS